MLKDDQKDLIASGPSCGLMTQQFEPRRSFVNKTHLDVQRGRLACVKVSQDGGVFRSHSPLSLPSVIVL